MKTIIRVEHPYDGNGIFNSRFEGNRRIDDSYVRYDLLTRHANFSSPENDSLIERCPEYNEYCAFKSIEQIQQWIEPSWFSELKRLGFEILAIEVSECIVGEYQILFKKENIISTKNISDLF